MFVRAVARAARTARRRDVGAVRSRRARSTTSSGSGVQASLSGSAVYETDVATNEYLQFHYATDSELCPFVDQSSENVADKYAGALGTLMQFPIECANKLSQAGGATESARGGRALDVGCSVGRTSFELSRTYDAVVGIDFSEAFVTAANAMKTQGSLPYSRIVSGDVTEEKIATAPVSEEHRARVAFHQGDACAIDLDALGGPFDGVVAANLLCRLPEPLAFLKSMEHVVNAGGSLVLISPYSWLEEYTSREKWIGWQGDMAGQLDSFAEVQQVLSDAGFELQERTNIPFVMREHKRKYQLGISECTSWKRTSSN